MKMNLKQKKILVTRNEPKASEFAMDIKKCNGQAVVTPLIKITDSPKKKNERILGNISEFEWLIFTSANGVRFFLKEMERRKTANQLKYCRIAVVGEKTNKSLQAFGYEADFIPTIFNAETMASEFLQAKMPIGPVLLVQGNLSRTILNRALQRHAIPFDCLEMYTTATNKGMKPRLQQILATEEVDYLTFTSPSTVDAFMELVDDKRTHVQQRIVCIGTTTEKRAAEYEFRKILVPDTFTTEGMLEVIHQDIVQEGRMNE